MTTVYTVPHTIKGNDIPKSWGVCTFPDQYYKVILEIVNEPDFPMPPEEQIRPEAIEAVRKSEESYRKGNFVRCHTKEERKQLFQRIWSDDE